jgi:hypothetical protein
MAVTRSPPDSKNCFPSDGDPIDSLAKARSRVDFKRKGTHNNMRHLGIFLKSLHAYAEAEVTS